ncbi:orotidine 5'-phosphate decarboxylase / HUMPS family protein [Streptomyces lavendulae]|uniref:orotidine 5'-phosphate decarboxylase / HUMPS family protein n=1 Tax=Streptomyces lavendulae TaxID=1914 RepID=UPI0024A13F9C|nr:orotidine 5'-phosphate decarboxylase / HUMPS family protein [Streptomyces lavendulae]GLW04784.1 hypothetical protein Slala05_84140 [Streptomyces lavendulae subsp. lavendulae]
MNPRLWIAYDYTDITECLDTLDRILTRHPDRDIIHEIGRPTVLAAALQGFPIVREFRTRLDGGQQLVAGIKGYDVPYSAEASEYYKAGVDLVTVMATAPDEAIIEAVNGARNDSRLVAFDLMSHRNDASKVARAIQLVDMGAKLISCHTGWNEQAAGKTPHCLIGQLGEALEGHPDVCMIAMGGLAPESVFELAQLPSFSRIYAIVGGSSITRSGDPASVVQAFLDNLRHANFRQGDPS